MIYLASQSPRRQELLKQWQIPFRLLLPNDSREAEALEATLAQESPLDYVERVTRLKWTSASKRIQDEGLADLPILVADTTVALGSQILGKPTHADEARQMLRMLSEKSHHVHTAVAIGCHAHVECVVQTSVVTFGPISDMDIERYIQSQEPFGKAGSYGIQGLAGFWIRSIQGSYTGIMGLPAFETRQLLHRFGIATPV